MDKNLNASVDTKAIDSKTFPKIGRFFDGVVKWSLLLSVFLVPIIVLPFTIDVVELNKQVVFLLLMLIGFIAWMGRSMVSRKIIVTRSWLHLVVAAFVLGYGIISWFSIDQYLSFVGRYGQLQWSFSTIVGLGLFYFLLSQTIKKKKQYFELLFTFLFSSLLVTIMSILGVFGVPIFSWLGRVTDFKEFTPIGNINSLSIFLVTPLLISSSILMFKKGSEIVKKFSIVNALLILTVLSSLFVVLLTDFWVAWLMIAVGAVLMVALPMIRTKKVAWSFNYLIPAILLGVSVIFLIVQAPTIAELGAEVSPSAKASWNIARETLQTNPLTGSGPGTWVYDYAQNHALAVNLSPYWNVRFERGYSTFLTLFATVGLMGVSLWLILLVSGFVKSATYLFVEKSKENWELFLIFFVAWVPLVVSAFMYNYNVTHHFAFWLLFGLLASIFARSTLTWNTKKSVVHSSIFSLGFLIVVAGSLSGVWLLSQRYASDVYAAKAVYGNDAGDSFDATILRLESSIKLNPQTDVSYRNLSQVALFKTQEAFNEEASDGKTDRLNASVRLAIESARNATEVVPANVINWINFGDVLRAIASFTQGADEQAILMYEEALIREPNNPEIWNEIGEIRVLRADAYATLLASDDEDVIKEAQDNIVEELNIAFEAFNRSVQIKPDFENAHYNLALVYERQGQLPDAIVKLEQVLNENLQDVGLAFQLAILYYRNDDKAGSQDLFEQIVRISPENSNARWYLSALYEEQGMYDEALEQVYKVEEYNLDNEIVLERIDLLLGRISADAAPATVTLPEPVVDGVETPSSEAQEVR